MRTPLLLLALCACKGSSETKATPPAPPPAKPQPAKELRTETADTGDMRLFAGGVADLDGDGTLELVAGGFSSEETGRRPTVVVYRQAGDTWAPLTEASWDSAPGSMVRNVEIADTNGDGKLDVVALGRAGKTPHEAKAMVAIYDLAGGKLVKQAEQSWLEGTYTHGYGLAIADLDRDNKLEIVTTGFQFDGTTERGFVRVWSHGSELAQKAAITLEGEGSPSMRVNDIAIGDVDGDAAPDIVLAGRHGPLKGPHSKDLALRREFGDLGVLSYKDGKLAVRARYTWQKGTSARFRTVALVDLDGDPGLEMVAGGQYDKDGKVALATFDLADGKLVQRQDASTTAEGVTGELKDLLVAHVGKAVRVLATGAMGSKGARQGNTVAWRIENGQIVRDASIVSKNGDDTQVRALVVNGDKVLTIGFARNSATIVGQLLEWNGPLL
jgi:hypothetical protein